MHTYKICFSFDSSEVIDYRDYKDTFEDAKKKFNEISEKRGKGRVISDLDLAANEFYITLLSSNDLEKPSKALAKFSAILIETGMFDRYVSGNHLLRSKWVDNISDDNTLTDTELLTTLIRWILKDESKNDTPDMKLKKRQVIERVKELILNAGIIIR